jgi:glycosyltransferase involved in cell wall biosynthesis
MRYAETLANQGDQVDVIALRQDGQEYCGTLRGVRVMRIQHRIKNERRQLTYAYRVFKFMVKASIIISKEHAAHPYDLIHVHNMPDFLVFSAFYAKLTGAKVILDIHDVVPELYGSMFARGQKSFLFKLMLLFEKLSARFADHVIVANHVWHETVKKRSVKKADGCSVVLNYPDERIFFRRPANRSRDKFVMVYPGSLNRRQGVDIAIKALAIVKDQLPQVEFHIYGDGAGREELEALTLALGLSDRVLFKGSLPIYEVAEKMAAADLGVEPKRNDPFAGDAMSTKILEFMSLGVPIVASDTRIHKHYFNDNVVKFFKSENEADLAEAILAVVRDKDYRDRLIEAGSNFAAGFTWEKNKHYYLSLLDRLIERKEVGVHGC